MNAYVLALLLILGCLVHSCNSGRVTGEPHATANILITEFIENAITSEDNKVVLFRNLVNSHLRFGFDYIWVATSILQFGLGVSESAAN